MYYNNEGSHNYKEKFVFLCVCVCCTGGAVWVVVFTRALSVSKLNVLFVENC